VYSVQVPPGKPPPPPSGNNDLQPRGGGAGRYISLYTTHLALPAPQPIHDDDESITQLSHQERTGRYEPSYQTTSVHAKDTNSLCKPSSTTLLRARRASGGVAIHQIVFWRGGCGNMDTGGRCCTPRALELYFMELQYVQAWGWACAGGVGFRKGAAGLASSDQKQMHRKACKRADGWLRRRVLVLGRSAGLNFFHLP
jgi:hypothetical protein